MKWPAFAGAGLAFLLALPPLRSLLESTLYAHLLLQFPLLIASGYLLGTGLRIIAAKLFEPCNGRGVPFTLLAAFCLIYWLLPRNLDQAIQDPLMGWLKIFSLILLCGTPLAWSWSLLGPLGRAFVLANLATMLGFMGGLYLASPVRLCSSYLLNDQQSTGPVACALGIGLAFLTVFYLLGQASRKNDA